MAELARLRPIFHSEADFQHAFAWQAHQLDPALRVRLEIGVAGAAGQERLDVLLLRPDLGAATALELKFLKARYETTVDGEPFVLQNHGAHDIRRYDVVKDIARLEHLVAGRPGWNGLMVCLTNDPLHWQVPRVARQTVAEAFRLHEGTVLAGERAWGSRAGVGTTRTREQRLALRGTYQLGWRDYSKLPARNGVFRVLGVEVPAESVLGR